MKRVLVTKAFARFLMGRDKSDPGTDFTRAQEEAAKELASGFVALNASQMRLAIEDGALKEICRGEDNAIQP
jgi:hypothetical protein